MQDYMFRIEVKEEVYYSVVTAESMFDACLRLDNEADKLRSLDGIVINGFIECIGHSDHDPSTVEGVFGSLWTWAD